MVSESVSGTMDAKQSMKDDKQKQSCDSGDAGAEFGGDGGVYGDMVFDNVKAVAPRARSDTSCARVLERLQSAAKARPFKLVFVEADAAAQWAGRLQ